MFESNNIAGVDNCRLVVDTCCDITPHIAEVLKVEVLSFPFTMGDEEMWDDMGKTLPYEQFYRRLRNGEKCSTAAYPPYKLQEYFEKCAKDGTPTVYFSLTAGLSSSYDTACRVAQLVQTEYPDFELYVIDNCTPAAAGLLLAIEAVRQRSRGLSAAEIAQWADEAKYFVNAYFTLESLDSLVAGGRVPPAAAQLSKTLNVKAELSFDDAGVLSLNGVSRGRKKALKSLISGFKKHYNHDKKMPVVIISADADKDAKWLEETLRKEDDCEDLNVLHVPLDPTITAHTGAGMVAVAFWGDDRRAASSIVDRIATSVRHQK